MIGVSQAVVRLLVVAADHVVGAGEEVARCQGRVKHVLEDQTADAVVTLRYTLGRLDVVRARLETARDQMQTIATQLELLAQKGELP